nr:serine O-acetyltransferase [Entomobacter blattae]
MRQQAQSCRDPLSRQLLEATILQHENLPSALCTLLGHKLGNSAISAQNLMDVFADIYHNYAAPLNAAAEDLQAIFERDAACPDLITPFMFFKGFHAMQTYRLAHWLWLKEKRYLALHLQSRGSEVFGVDIHPAARMGCRILLDHATGIVIGETCVVENDVSLLQGVTLGGTGKNMGDRHPKVRRGVLIGAGAKVLGNIVIGEGAKIGAGSIVLESVHAYTTVVGNPARRVGVRNTAMPALTMDQTLPPIDYII